MKFTIRISTILHNKESQKHTHVQNACTWMQIQCSLYMDKWHTYYRTHNAYIWVCMYRHTASKNMINVDDKYKSHTYTTQYTLYSTYRSHVQHSTHCSMYRSLYNTVHTVQYVQISYNTAYTVQYVQISCTTQHTLYSIIQISCTIQCTLYSLLKCHVQHIEYTSDSP